MVLAAALHAAAEAAVQLPASSSLGTTAELAACPSPAEAAQQNGQQDVTVSAQQPETSANKTQQTATDAINQLETDAEAYNDTLQCETAQQRTALHAAAEALLELAAGPLGAPLRRHLLSAVGDVISLAGVMLGNARRAGPIRQHVCWHAAEAMDCEGDIA